MSGITKLFDRRRGWIGRRLVRLAMTLRAPLRPADSKLLAAADKYAPERAAEIREAGKMSGLERLKLNRQIRDAMRQQIGILAHAKRQAGGARPARVAGRRRKK